MCLEANRMVVVQLGGKGKDRKVMVRQVQGNVKSVSAQRKYIEIYFRYAHEFARSVNVLVSPANL